MSADSDAPHGRSALRYSAWDALLISLALLHGIVLTLRPAAVVVGVAMWWCANTVAHDFIHTPFFRRRILNRLMSFYLSMVLGVPQTVWRERHLAHHADIKWRFRLSQSLLIETALVVVVWFALLVASPSYFLTAYLPGLGIGLGLCWLHGHFEHAQGTTSHYGRVYNLLFFNDGYHVEHHASSGVHWTLLPQRVSPTAQASRWPAVCRWLDLLSLNSLERIVLRSPILQRWVLDRHECAFRRILLEIPEPKRIAIVGGALFPRTALLLGKLLPNAQLVVIDADERHIDIARPRVAPNVEFVCEWFDPTVHCAFDVVVFPLAFVGDKVGLYQNPPAPFVILHDWLWRRRGTSRIVSLFLLKRLNLVTREENSVSSGCSTPSKSSHRFPL